MIGSRGGQGQGGQPQAQAGARWLAEPRTEAEALLRQALDRAVSREADEVALRRVWARVADPEALMPGTAGFSAGDPDRQTGQREGGITRRPRWPWIAGACLAGAMGALAFMLVETKSEVRFAVVRKGAPVSAVNAINGSREASDLRSAVVAPATVRTGSGETLHLTLRGGTEVAVTSQSALVLDENDRPSVSAGEVRFRVPAQAPGRTFAVTIGSYRVVVVGTRFRVRVNPRNTVVGVDEGVVEIWNDHRVARIGAGESWSSPEVPEAVVAPPAPAPVTVPEVAVPTRLAVGKAARGSRAMRSHRAKVAIAATSGSTARVSSTHAAPPSPAPSPSDVGRTLALASPSITAPAVAAPVASRTVSPAASTSEPAVVTTAPGVTPSSGPVPGPALSPPTAAIAPDVAPLMVQAREARVVGDFRRALELYRTLAQRPGPAGENAEYEMGRVQRDGLRQPREAISTWRQYRARHPHGVLRSEADLSVIETLVSVGDKAGALAESSDFIARYPESERRLEVARLSGDLLRERGDCAGAIGAYDTALASRRSRKDSSRDIVDGVSFHRSTCLLGSNHGAGVAALKAYLQQFPWGNFRGDAERLLRDAQSPTRTASP